MGWTIVAAVSLRPVSIWEERGLGGSARYLQVSIGPSGVCKMLREKKEKEEQVTDRKLEVPLGMAYNSYVIKDEKIAVMDTVDQNFGDEWLQNLKSEIGDAKVDFLVVHHMEPDHSANIAKFAAAYPEAKIVSSLPAFAMMKNFFGTDFADRRVIVKEGDTLALGRHTLAFVGAPLGGDAYRNTITNLGGNPDDPFQIFPEVKELYAKRAAELEKIVA